MAFRGADDAGRLREDLAAELVLWRYEGLVPSHRAERFHRLVGRLARLTGLSRDDVYRDLCHDADAIADAESA